MYSLLSASSRQSECQAFPASRLLPGSLYIRKLAGQNHALDQRPPPPPLLVLGEASSPAALVPGCLYWPSFASTPTVCFSTRLSWSADSIARKSLRRSGYSAALNKFAHRVVPTDRHTSQPTLALDQETRVALEVRLRRTRHRVHLRHLRQLSPHRILDQQPVVKVHRLLPLFARKRRFPVALEQRARNQQALASRRSDRPFTSNFTTSGFSHSSSGVIDPTVNSIPPGNNACTFLIRHAPSNKPSGQLLPCGAKVLSVLSC